MFSYLIHQEAQLVVARFGGEVDAADFRRFFDRLNVDPDYVHSMNGLVDLRWLLPNISPEELHDLADYVVSMNLKNGRWALIVDQPRATALSMLYTKAIDSRYALQVFSTLEGVSGYLGINAADFLEADHSREA